MDEQIRPMASHDQGGEVDPPMTSEEAKAIVAHYKDDVPGIMALMPKLSGPEKETLMSQMSVAHGEPGITPGLVGGAVGLGKQALKYAPSLSKVGGAVKGTVGGVLGYEGTKAITDAIGLPPGIANIVNMIGVGLGHHASGGFGSTPPAGAAAGDAAMEAELTALRTRGQKISTVTPPSPMPSTPGKYPVPNSSVGVEIPKPLTRADMPPNVDFHRTNADLAEQTARGVQNNFKGRVSIQKPMEAPAKPTGRSDTPPADPNVRVRHLSEGEEDGIARLGYHMDATGTGTKGNGQYKEPTSSLKREFPPGTSKRTSPDDFEEHSKDFAEKQTDKVALKKARTKIDQELDANDPKPKLKKKSK